MDAGRVWKKARVLGLEGCKYMCITYTVPHCEQCQLNDREVCICESVYN